MLRRVVWYKLTDVSEVLTAMINLMMEAVSISETSVNFYETTPRNIPEDSHFYKIHMIYNLWHEVCFINCCAMYFNASQSFSYSIRSQFLYITLPAFILVLQHKRFTAGSAEALNC
jgi:hypothetical protein